ncbi:MAG: hypothetical protein AAGE52_26950 [Myxococcota bacterium]
MRRLLVIAFFVAPLGVIGQPVIDALHAGEVLRAATTEQRAAPLTELRRPHRVLRFGLDGPDLVLVHGAHREGVDEPRFRALAVALANEGFRVHVPELPALSNLRLRASDLDVILETAPPDASLFGISLGGGMVIRLAAEHPGRFRAVWTLGAHHDLAEVVDAHRSPGGHPYVRELFTSALGPRFEEEGSAPFALRLARVSPRGSLGQITTPLFVLHGRADELVSPAQATAICEEAPQCDVHLTNVLGHSDVAEASLRDRWQLARFVSRALRALKRAPVASASASTARSQTP